MAPPTKGTNVFATMLKSVYLVDRWKRVMKNKRMSIKCNDEENSSRLMVKGRWSNKKEADKAAVSSGLTADLYLFTFVAPVVSRCVRWAAPTGSAQPMLAPQFLPGRP